MPGALPIAVADSLTSAGATAAGIAVGAFLATLGALEVARRLRRRRRRGAQKKRQGRARGDLYRGSLDFEPASAEFGVAGDPTEGAPAGRGRPPGPPPPVAPANHAGSAAQILQAKARAPQGVALAEWQALVQEVASSEGILAETRGRLSQRRSLQSLLASIRDRDLLYERGERIGRQIFSRSYSDFGDRLTRNSVCAEAQFRKAAGDAIHIKLVATSMAKDAPVIGTCVCFIESGLLAGGLGNLEKRAFEVREVRCLAKGDPLCEFRAEPRESEEETDWTLDPTGLTGREVENA